MLPALHALSHLALVCRPQLAEEAFETWGVARLGMASACGLALWASNVPDMGALVIDFGHLLTSATPFYAGYPLQQDPANTVYGGLHATCALEEALPPDARAYAEFLKIRHGTVHSQTGPQYYELPDGTKLCLGPDAISRHVRACADAVLREIPMERDPFRGRTACKRIVLCGGGGAVEDLPEYLAHRTGVPCWVNQDPQSLAWLGASLLGGMRSQFESRSVTKEEHEEKGGASLYAARCLL